MNIPKKILKKYLEVYPEAESQAKIFLDSRNSEPDFIWPDWCYLPLAASYAIATYEAAKQGISAERVILDVGNLGAVLAWKKSKAMLNIETEKLNEIWSKPLENFSIESLYNLPEFCIYFDIQNLKEPLEIIGFFVYLEYDAKYKHSELRISFANKDLILTTLPFHLSGVKTIPEMFRTTINYMAMQQPGNIGIFQIPLDLQTDKGIEYAFKGFFNLISYVIKKEKIKK